ncbi:MAG: hypothetical protein KDA24_04870 [Deltaproteobacteria bacterium]|nr:hypothetical protein [Deltaproteobacteria bacterium]
MTRHLLVIACLLWLLPSCATTRAGQGTAPIRGIVVTSSEDAAIRLDEQGLIRTLAGPRQLLDQLARIPGAYVSVVGAGTTTTVRVKDFEIIDAGDGLRPLVGWLIVDQSGVQLADSVTGTRLALRGQPLAKLRAEHGARIWVTGSVVGPQTLLVAHWGILIPR